MKFSLILLILICVFFSGCYYNKLKETVVVENTNAGIQKTQEQIDAENRLLTEDPLILSSTSDLKTIPCNNREIEITNDATSNNFRLTGECKKVTVDGVANDVKVEKVAEIIVKGTSNKVSYGEGVDGKKPKITKTGISTSVDSMPSLKEKKEAEIK
jgi:hypothetical protein